MFLPSLLGHTAELLRVIKKSPQPADSIASEYFRSKKYIGSKERRFISELVFASLRTLSAAEHCATAAIPAEKPSAQQLPAPGKKPVDAGAVAVVAAALMLGNVLGSTNSAELLASLPGGGAVGSVAHSAGEAWAHVAGYSAEQGRAWADAVLAAWGQLDAQCERIVQQGLPTDDELRLLSARYCVQPWMLQSWKNDRFHDRTWRDVVGLAASLVPSAALNLRTNTLMLPRDKAVQQLLQQGIDAAPGALSPDAVVCQKRVDLRKLDMVTSGVLEVQDEASQMVAYGLAPEEDWTVLDACAGAGGKSLHIAVLQRDRGEVVAADIEFKRLKEVSFRARRSGLSSIRTVPLGRGTRPGELPRELERYRNRCDAVVVDAPCSGMGTVRRMPLPKWRLTPELVARHAAKQLSVLSAYAPCVKPGGVLLYSTCSVMPQENDEVVESFMARHPDFVAEALVPVFAGRVQVPGLADDCATLTLTPAEHGTDGFFLARMRRR